MNDDLDTLLIFHLVVSRCSVDSMTLAATPPSLRHKHLGLPHPSPTPEPSTSSSSLGPLVYLAAGRNEVGLWDVVEGRCIQVLRGLDSQEVLSLEQPQRSPSSSSGGGAEGGAHTLFTPYALQPSLKGHSDLFLNPTLSSSSAALSSHRDPTRRKQLSSSLASSKRGEGGEGGEGGGWEAAVAAAMGDRKSVV